MIDDKLIGPYQLPNTLTGETYVDFLRDDLPGLLDEWLTSEEQENIIFQHDGASPHTAVVTRNFLNNNYPNRWIGQRGGIIEWPARSPDYNPCDYGLWGTFKDKLYHRGGNFYGDREQCLNEIFNIADRLEPEIIFNSTHAIVNRLVCSAQNRGSHFESKLR